MSLTGVDMTKANQKDMFFSFRGKVDFRNLLILENEMRIGHVN